VLTQPLISTSPMTTELSDMGEAMSLGATMYVPILHPAIREIVLGLKYPNLKSVVLCLEDALHVSDIDRGLHLLAKLMGELEGQACGPGQPWLFVRPRNMDMARVICGLRGIGRIDGLVIPKLRVEQVEDWWQLAGDANMRLMPTLESAWVLDPGALSEFASVLDAQARHRLIALRIGGNDLLATLQLRRVRGETIYDGPLAWALSQIMCQLGARGYALTAPVFDVLDDPVTLARECARDAAFGFVGKTAVHPDQIDVIQHSFAARREDVALAHQTLNPGADAVFRVAGMMLEPATHQGWAKRTLTRAAVYGVVDDRKQAMIKARAPILYGFGTEDTELG
jgi:citrate lyase beta subunit